MTRLKRAGLVGVALTTLVVFGLLIPLVADQGPTTQRLTADTVIGTTYGAATLPAGWDLNIAAAASSSPVVTKGDVTIGVGDGVWFEGSAGLLENIADLIYNTPAILPPAPEDDGPFSNLAGSVTEDPEEYEPVRQVFRISAGLNAASSEPRFIDVVRYGESVIYVIVRGDDAAVARELDTVQAIVDSVTFASAEPGLEPRP